MLARQRPSKVRVFHNMSSTMLARGALARAAAQQRTVGAAPPNARNMATLREIELRLKSVRNIEKITKVSWVRWWLFIEPTRLTLSSVHENDCVDKACKSPARDASRKGIRARKRWHVIHLLMSKHALTLWQRFSNMPRTNHPLTSSLSSSLPTRVSAVAFTPPSPKLPVEPSPMTSNRLSQVGRMPALTQSLPS